MINFKTITDGVKVVGKWAARNMPTILTVIGVGMMTGATVDAIKEAPVAKEELDILEEEELTHKEYFAKKTKIIVKHYWKVAVLDILGGVSIFGGNHINLRRIATATALLSTKTDELKKLEEKVLEKDGKKKLQKYKDEIIQEKVKNAAGDSFDISTVYNTGKGTALCFDSIGQRFFLSDLEYIRQMRDEFNSALAEQMQRHKEAVMSLNDWYGYIGLPPLDGRFNGKRMGPDLGKDLGWRNRLMQLKFTAGMLDNDQTYSVIGFTDAGGPKWDLDISDDYGSDYTDDETDTPWRGR